MTEQPDITADRVASVNIYRKADAPSPDQVAALLPANYRVGKGHSSWNIIVRGKDADGAALEDVIQRLAGEGIEASEVQRETNAVYQFRTGKDGGSGSFLCPPGHPNLRYSIYGFHSPGSGTPRVNRPSGPDVIMSLEGLAEDEGGYYPKPAVERARRILAEATAEPSEKWVRHTYAYFRNSYSPDGTNRNVSDAISSGKAHCQCGEDFWNRKSLNRHVDSERATTTGPEGRSARGNAGHYEITKPPPPAEHHLGYLAVKEYFPGHQVREDLIADPGRAYGRYPCDKCGQPVQYEARQDAWCVVKTGPWSYDPDCPKGGQHQVDPHPACNDCGCQS